MAKLKGFSDVEILWQDKKRYFGLPISFTRYALIMKPGLYVKLVCVKGWLSTNVEEVMAYRVDDISVRQSVTDRLFGVGSIDVYCKDATCEVLHIQSVKNPIKVKELLNDEVEKDKINRGMRYGEMATQY